MNTLSWRLKAGITLALILVLVKFALVPLYAWQDETLDMIQVLQKGLAQKKALMGNEQRIDELLKRSESALEEVLTYYYQDFSDPQSLQLLLQKEIEQLSSASDVKIKSKDWLPLSAGDIIRAPIKIRCEGIPASLFGFISAIENADHFFTVDRLTLTSQGKSSMIQADMDISAYGIQRFKGSRLR